MVKPSAGIAGSLSCRARYQVKPDSHDLNRPWYDIRTNETHFDTALPNQQDTKRKRDVLHETEQPLSGRALRAIRHRDFARPFLYSFIGHVLYNFIGH